MVEKTDFENGMILGTFKVWWPWLWP